LSRHAITVAVAAAFALVALAGCGGDDDTTTVTTTAEQTAGSCTSQASPNVTGLEVTNMSCEEADALTGDVIQSLSREPFTAAGFECEIRGQSGPDSGAILGAEDITCTSGDRTFVFSFGD
jgi:hypothetical protein